MSKYTTELRFLIEMNYNLGLTDYPIFNEDYRNTLNNKILNHYKFREIGFETAGLFKDRLNERMNMIMPYYNQLYSSAELEFNPLLNFSTNENSTGNDTNNTTTQNTTNSTTKDTVTDTGSGEETSNETGNSTTESTDTKSRKDIGSDTPQGLLSLDTIDTNIYASTVAIGNETDEHNEESNNTVNSTKNTSTTNTREADGNTNVTGNSTQSETKKNVYERIFSGFQGVSGSELLQKFRDTFLNIDRMVIDELNDLFMGVL